MGHDYLWRECLYLRLINRTAQTEAWPPPPPAQLCSRLPCSRARAILTYLCSGISADHLVCKIVMEELLPQVHRLEMLLLTHTRSW